VDPGNFTLRSCAFTFDQLGNYARATEFLQLDAGSEWSTSNTIRHYFRDGKLAQAREALRAQSDRPWSRFMTACANDPSSVNAANLSEKVSAFYLADPDAEVRFMIASDLSSCGQKELALRMLKSSIDGHYCGYMGLKNDSLWDKVRGTPEFDGIVREAKQCQDDFRAEMAKAGQ
jgi:hypothetical protein